ncbi:hypothetical protein [Methylorubrum salsuginis]|uniref:DUF3313 domain-containing protein n=1 Tax=Methylorubrum salsuginis TaxID=414703 RepID=A0A1I4HF51_9HYPH|nr:hypothetical protein [Methylorubrum salsuginis]SFL40928.1 hypothetical protein SAMN04488125_11491 [Methylorubrum salsuginis]
MFRLSLAALLLAVGLSACATVAPNTLSPQETADLKFTSLEVVVPPETRIDWSSAEDDYLSERKLSRTDPALVVTPEARAHLRNLAAARLKAKLQRVIAERPAGTRPVRLVATIREVSIPSAVKRVIIGGTPSIRGDVDVIDARTGALLTTYRGALGTKYAGNGVYGVIGDGLAQAMGADDLYDRAAADYADGFGDWLKPR